MIPNAVKPVHRSLVIARRGTSVALEAPFWAALERAASRRSLTLGELIDIIACAPPPAAMNLTSALRLFCLAEETVR